MPGVLVDDPAGLPVAARPQHGAVRPGVQCQGHRRTAAAADGRQQAQGEETSGGRGVQISYSSKSITITVQKCFVTSKSPKVLAQKHT